MNIKIDINSIISYIVSLFISVFTVYVVLFFTERLAFEFDLGTDIFKFFGKNAIYYSMILLFILSNKKKG